MTFHLTLQPAQFARGCAIRYVLKPLTLPGRADAGQRPYCTVPVQMYTRPSQFRAPQWAFLVSCLLSARTRTVPPSPPPFRRRQTRSPIRSPPPPQHVTPPARRAAAPSAARRQLGGGPPPPPRTCRGRGGRRGGEGSCARPTASGGGEGGRLCRCRSAQGQAPPAPPRPPLGGCRRHIGGRRRRDQPVERRRRGRTRRCCGGRRQAGQRGRYGRRHAGGNDRRSGGRRPDRLAAARSGERRGDRRGQRGGRRRQRCRCVNGRSPLDRRRRGDCGGQRGGYHLCSCGPHCVVCGRHQRWRGGRGGTPRRGHLHRPVGQRRHGRDYPATVPVSVGDGAHHCRGGSCRGGACSQRDQLLVYVRAAAGGRSLRRRPGSGRAAPGCGGSHDLVGCGGRGGRCRSLAHRRTAGKRHRGSPVGAAPTHAGGCSIDSSAQQGAQLSQHPVDDRHHRQGYDNHIPIIATPALTVLSLGATFTKQWRRPKQGGRYGSFRGRHSNRGARIAGHGGCHKRGSRGRAAAVPAFDSSNLGEPLRRGGAAVHIGRRCRRVKGGGQCFGRRTSVGAAEKGGGSRTKSGKAAMGGAKRGQRCGCANSGKGRHPAACRHVSVPPNPFTVCCCNGHHRPCRRRCCCHPVCPPSQRWQKHSNHAPAPIVKRSAASSHRMHTGDPRRRRLVSRLGSQHSRGRQQHCLQVVVIVIDRGVDRVGRGGEVVPPERGGACQPHRRGRLAVA